MSTSSRSTIFSLRSKKSKDSAELRTHAGPAYDTLPMSPRPPISMPTLIPPSQNGRGDATQSRLFGGTEYLDDDGDAVSVKSEPRNGNPHSGHQASVRGSTSVASLGGISGPRPLPPRSGSAEKMHDSWKHIPLGFSETSHVRIITDLFNARNSTRNGRLRITGQQSLAPRISLLRDPILSAWQWHHHPWAETMQGLYPMTTPDE